MRAMAQAAGLRVHGDHQHDGGTGSGHQPAARRRRAGAESGPSAELVVQHGLDPRICHLNVVGGAELISALAGEIRRTMAAIPQNGTPMTMALWNSGSVENPQSVLEQRLSMPVTTPEVRIWW